MTFIEKAKKAEDFYTKCQMRNVVANTGNVAVDDDGNCIMLSGKKTKQELKGLTIFKVIYRDGFSYAVKQDTVY